MCSFAKEGGGGTPPVPLEPSKKSQICDFLLYCGFIHSISSFSTTHIMRLIASMYC